MGRDARWLAIVCAACHAEPSPPVTMRFASRVHASRGSASLLTMTLANERRLYVSDCNVS